MCFKALLPVAIGIVVIAWMMYREFTPGSLDAVRFDTHVWIGLALACIFVVGRDFGLSWRFHTIASPEVTWRKAVRTDMMCSFASAVTPSVVGGSAFAIFFLNREGLSVGRATALTLTTLFLDELFFVFFCPIIFLVVPIDMLFGEALNTTFAYGIELVFWLVYAGIVIWTSILFIGILVRPEGVRAILVRLFSVKILRRWLPAISETGDNLVLTSKWVRQQSIGWWCRVCAATVLSWLSRYLIVNSIFWAFVPDTSPLLVFCRQFVVWVVLMVSPTPGGSGISEWMFTEYYGDLIGGGELAVIMALIWRLITYYIYLIAGVCIIPHYLRKSK